MVEPLAFAPARGNRQAYEEAVCFKVMHEVESSGTRLLRSARRSARIDVPFTTQASRTMRGEQVNRGTGSQTRLQDAAPTDDQPMRRKALKLELGSTSSLKEQLLNQFTVQVAVLVKRHKDGDVSSGQRNIGFLLQKRYRTGSKFQIGMQVIALR